MKIGIDQISFYTTNLYLDLVDLAKARGVDPDKFTIGIGQDLQAVALASQDSISMAANAANDLIDIQDADLILFATESGTDNSKSGAVVVQNLLGINQFARTIELKQACYAGTAALMLGKEYLTNHPDKKVLVIASDIARYGIESPGEVTQGAGAVAMLLTSNPRLAVINDDSVYKSEDLADFWRPLYSDTAFVDGKYSQKIYNQFFLELWNKYKEANDSSIDDFAAFVFHLPYTKQGKKAFDQIANQSNNLKRLENNLLAGQIFNRQVGNIYTGSLYLSFISLLVNGDLQAGEKIGMYSYGSGAEAEFFSLELVENYKEQIMTDVKKLLAKRKQASVEEYQTIFKNQLEANKKDQKINLDLDDARYVLTGQSNGLRQYLKRD